MAVQKRTLLGLDHAEYEHPFDRAALETLEKTPGLDTLLEKIWKYGIENMLRIQYTGSYMKVTPNCFPRVHRLFVEAAEVLNLDISSVDFYLMQGPTINAHTTGVEKPIVAVNTWTVDMCTEEELQYIIAHELGHIKSRHVLYHQLASLVLSLGAIIGNITLGVGELLAKGIQIPLMHWSRMSEFTCDRAGLLVAQDIEVATTANMKMAGIPFTQRDQMNVASWREQAREFQAYDYDTLKKIMRLWALYNPDSTMTHPFGVIRAAELERWIGDGSYDRVLRRETVGMVPGAVAGGITCSRCGNPLGPQLRFCPACGAVCAAAPPVQEVMVGGYCTSCGNPLKGFEAFCPACGASRQGEARVKYFEGR